jgi:hypothetical protein
MSTHWSRLLQTPLLLGVLQVNYKYMYAYVMILSGTIIRGTLKTPNSQLVTPISIKLQRPDGYD